MSVTKKHLLTGLSLLLFFSFEFSFERNAQCASQPPAETRNYPQRVYLLTSLGWDYLKENLPSAYEYYQSGVMERELESIFRLYFPERHAQDAQLEAYSIQIRHQANRYDLENALRDPSAVAVIWLGHASAKVPDSDASSAHHSRATQATQAKMIDSQGFDVADVLQRAHPNLRVIGLVACNSDQIVQRLGMEFQRNHPQLQFVSSDHAIDAKLGLYRISKEVVRRIQKPEIRNGYTSTCPVIRGYRTLLVRKIKFANDSVIYPAVSVLQDGRVVGTFSAASPKAGDEIEQRLVALISATSSHFTPAQLKLVLTSGENAQVDPSSIQLGELTIESPWKGADWKVFSQLSGKPFGVTQNIYRYSGALEAQSEPGEFQVDRCGQKGGAILPVRDLGWGDEQ